MTSPELCWEGSGKLGALPDPALRVPIAAAANLTDGSNVAIGRARCTKMPVFLALPAQSGVLLQHREGCPVRKNWSTAASNVLTYGEGLRPGEYCLPTLSSKLQFSIRHT